ncbi:MAG: tetratricopeptide repeat protein [Planctomycetes bacterium]|nr:tetratricopeptide repeat protein [Planctomycetota bacterium]
MAQEAETTMDAEQTGRFFRRPGRMLAAAVWPGACVAVAAVAIYSNSLSCPFIFDDENSIVDNPTIRRPADIAAVLVPPHNGATVEGRPLVNLSLAANYAIGGLDVRPYHVLNLAIHVLAALALLGLARRTLELEGLPDWLRRPARSVAFAIAMVWAVHPIQTESVTYIIQRAESLMGLFYLATLYFFVRGATGAAWWHAAAVAACGLGMASKEVMASAPLIVLLYDRAFLAGSFRVALRRRWPVYACLAATWGILAALLAGSFERGGTAGMGMGVSPLDYAMTQCKVVCEYLVLCFWPTPLILDYNTPIIRDWRDALPYAAVLAALLAATIWALWRRPRIGFAAIAFFAILAPTSSFIPVKDAQFEHRMYLPLAAVAALAIFAAQGAFTRLGETFPKRGVLVRTGAWLALAGVCATMCVATFMRNRDYRSMLSIWRATADARPGNDRAWYNLARANHEANNPNEALDAYNKALAIRPDAIARSSRGNVLKELGRADEAMADYAAAIAMAPRYADAYYNRANLHLAARRFDQAAGDYGKAVELKDDFLEAYVNRGTALAEMGRMNDALADFDRAVALRPDFAQAYRARAIAYCRLARRADAMADYNKFIQLGGRPDEHLMRILGLGK